MAAVIHEKGPPDNFLWEEIKVGSPERGEVRLRSKAIGVNFADTYHRAGIPHPMIVGDPPIVLGFEGVAEIEELGPGVTGFSLGERVCTFLPPLGAYCQERLYPADKLIKVPKALPLDDVKLAGLILKGMTAQYLLHRTHKVQPGDFVLIHAAAGGMTRQGLCSEEARWTFSKKLLHFFPPRDSSPCRYSRRRARPR